MQLSTQTPSNIDINSILGIGIAEATKIESRFPGEPLDPSRVLQTVEKRTCSEINEYIVIAQILDRYSEIVLSSLESLQGKFSCKDMIRLMNAYPQPYWAKNHLDLASMIVDDLGLEMPSESCPEDILDLDNRLAELTFPERVALVDTIERLWRSPGRPEVAGLSTYREIFEAMGLKLRDNSCG